MAFSESQDGLLMKPMDDDSARQVAHAERFMDKYKTALKKLAE